MALAAQIEMGSATACPAKPWRSGVPGRNHRRPAGDVGDVSGEDAGHRVRDAHAPHLSSPQMVAAWQMALPSHAGQTKIRPNQTKKAAAPPARVGRGQPSTHDGRWHQYPASRAIKRNQAESSVPAKKIQRAQSL